MKNILSLIIALLTIIGITFGVYFYMEKRYALADELTKVTQRLDEKIDSDRYNQIQDRIWKIQDRYRNKQMEDTVKEELRQLEKEKEELNNKIKKFEGR